MFSPETLAPHQLNLQFFDVTARIKTDSKSCIEGFNRLYHRFRTNGKATNTQTLLNVTILTQPENTGGRPVMMIDEQIWPLADSGLLQEYIYESVLKAILARVRSHFLIHAGVVAYNGKGVILAADSFHGKTTLVLELVRRGFKFLSDETAALERADRQVHPYPRTLRIRSGSLERVGFSQKATESSSWLGKWLLDVEEIRANSLGWPVPVSHVIILQDPTTPLPERPGDSEREIEVVVDCLDENFLNDVRQIEGVTQVEVKSGQIYPRLKLRAFRRTSVFSQIEALCQAQERLILDVMDGTPQRPTFATAARLQAMPTSWAALQLLRRFQGGHKSALLQKDFNDNSSLLLMELATLIKQAKCYQLSVGPLDKMANLICNLVQE